MESQNAKINGHNGHKNKKKSSSPENRYFNFSYNNNTSTKFTYKITISFSRKGKVKTPNSIPSAEEEQLNTLEGECTENKRNLIKEIWNTGPSLSNNQSEGDTQNGIIKINYFLLH